MPYVLKEDGTPFLDKDGNKVEFSIEYSDGDWYKHKEPLHINDAGHIDTEDRYLVVKDGISLNHAVSIKQLNEKLSALQKLINTSINSLIKAYEAKILKKMFKFRNEQVKNRIQRKYLSIPKTVNKWIKLFDNKDVGDNVVDLKNIIVLNVWIKRWDRYHNGKSALLEKDFDNSIEFFYNSDMTGYYTYFTKIPSNWSMDCIIEWLRIPQPISIDNENIPSKPESNE